MMSSLKTIYKKELLGYFNSMIAYVVLTVYIVITNWLFFRGFFIINQANMRNYFSLLPWVFLFFVPAITMRLWSEERKSGTIELLLTFPINDYEVVLGKYLAALTFLSIGLLLSFTIPITLLILGQPDVGVIIGGYLGALLLGAAYLSIGSYISSLTGNQIVSFILSVSVIFVLFLLGQSFFLYTMPEKLAPLFKYLGLGAHFDSVSRGVIDSRDIIYYLSVITLFLYFNVKFIESRKWK